MTWILTALTGALLSGFLLLLVSLLLRYPTQSIQLGPWKWTGLIHYFIHANLTSQLNRWFLLIRPAEQIQNQLLKSATREQVEQWLLRQADQYLTVTVPQKWPMLSMLIGDKTQEKVRHAISSHILENWNASIEGLSRQFLTNEQLSAKLTDFLSEPKILEGIAFHVWRATKQVMLRWSPLFLILGSVLAVVGRSIYQCFSSF